MLPLLPHPVIAPQAYILCFHFSLILSFANIMGAVSLVTAVDACVTKKEILSFIKKCVHAQLLLPAP